MGYADAGASGSVAGSSSTDDIRSQPTSGLTSSGADGAPIPDSDPGAAALDTNVSANPAIAVFSAPSFSSDRSPLSRIAVGISGAASPGSR